MTASTVKSTLVTNAQTKGILEGEPKVKGLLRSVSETIEAATTSLDEIADAIMMIPLPTRAVVKSITLFSDALDSHSTPTLATDIGLWHCTGTGTADGTVISQTCIATAITDLRAGSKVGVEVLFEANDIANINKRLWEVAGLSADPGGQLMIGLKHTAAAATAAAGTITMKVDFILD